MLQENDCTFLNIFETPDATQDQIWKAGEMFEGKDTGMSLDTFRYISYMGMLKMSQKKVDSSFGAFQLEALPPTSAAIKYHIHRTYFAVQEWLGITLKATNCSMRIN